MRGWTAACLVPLLVALRASAHGYVSKIVIDGVAYAGNEPNDDTGESSWLMFWLSGWGVMALEYVVVARPPRCSTTFVRKASMAWMWDGILDYPAFALSYT